MYYIHVFWVAISQEKKRRERSQCELKDEKQ